MRIADEPDLAEPIQGQASACRREDTAEAVASQGAKYLDLEKVRHVQGLARLRDSLPHASGFQTNVQQDGNRRRCVENDQGALAGIAGIVSVAHPADGNLRRLV